MSANPTDTAPPAELQRLRFLMRSGNSFMVDGVQEWEIDRAAVSGRIVKLRLKQSLDSKFARVIVETIDLSQIEAVVILPAGGFGRRANEKEDARG